VQISDDEAKCAYAALGDLAEALALGVEAMTRVAIAIRPQPTAPDILLTNPITCATDVRANED
jgi:hypothetical protein